MRPWVWVSRRLRVSARQLWLGLLRRAAAAGLFLLFCCSCVYIHLRSLPERPGLQQLLQQHLHRQAGESLAGICNSIRALGPPLLHALAIFGALILDVSSLVFLWLKFLYPLVAPVVVKAVRLYLQLQPQQQVLLAAAAAAIPLFYLLRISERLQRLKAATLSLYCLLTSYVAAGAPLALTLLLHFCCCLLFGISRVSDCLRAVWLPLPLVGSAAFAAANLDIFRVISAAAAAAAAAEAANEAAATKTDTLSPAAAAAAAKATATAAAAATAARAERRLKALRSLNFWLMLWFLQGLGCTLSGLLLLLPLPVPLRVYVEAATLHAVLLFLLLGLLTGGSSSVLLFVYGLKCIRVFMRALNLLSGKFFGLTLLLPEQQQQQQQHQHQQQLVLLAQQQQQHLAAAASAARKRPPSSTLQLAKAFRLNEAEVLLLHCLPDFSPLEETLQQQQQQAAASSKSVLQRLSSAAAAALGVSSASSGSNGAAAAAAGSSSSSSSSVFSPSTWWRLLLQQQLERLGLLLSPSLLYIAAAALQYTPELLLLLLPSFLLGPVLLLLLRVVPLIGTLGCLSRCGSVSSRLYWLCYFWGAAAAYNTHTFLSEHAVLRLLPLQQTRLLLLLWGVQTAAKVISRIAKLDPIEPPMQQQQQQLKNSQKTNHSTNSSSRSSSSRSSSSRSSNSTSSNSKRASKQVTEGSTAVQQAAAAGTVQQAAAAAAAVQHAF